MSRLSPEAFLCFLCIEPNQGLVERTVVGGIHLLPRRDLAVYIFNSPLNPLSPRAAVSQRTRLWRQSCMVTLYVFPDVKKINMVCET